MKKAMLLTWAMVGCLLLAGGTVLAKIRPASLCLSSEALPQGGVLYWVRVPASYEVKPLVPAKVTRLEAVKEPLAVINGGFFDVHNGLTTSHLVVDGRVVGDPAQNPGLTENVKLQPYLPQIYNRSEFRVYQCGQARKYDIVRHEAATPTGCTLQHALGAGPMMLPEASAEAEAFIQTDVNGRRIRDAIGYDRPNARSAVGLTANGDVLLVMAAQDPKAPKNTGLGLPELATRMQKLGAVKILALDGGSSSGIRVGAETRYGRFEEKDGKPVKRSVQSFLGVFPAAP